MQLELLKQGISAFFATFAFAVLFDIEKKEFLFCGIVGAVSQIIYSSITMNQGSIIGACIIAAGIVTALARIFANIRKQPVTLYLTTGILVLVPGTGIYTMVEEMITASYHISSMAGVETMQASIGIVIGIIIMLFLPNWLFFGKINA